ncbi:MAG: hypothetical protein OXD34_13995 [bacterium]|nr:hypothetical protein [bacterium]
MADRQLAVVARQALDRYRDLRAETADASLVVDSAVLRALDVGGWSYSTLAEVLDVSKGAVQKRATNARRARG